LQYDELLVLCGTGHEMKV